VIPPMSARAIGTRVSSSPADPHRIGPLGGWHFGLMAGLTLRGVVPLPETLRARRTRIRKDSCLAHSLFGEAGARKRGVGLMGLPSRGELVIDRSSVSAFGWSPIRQREVLLARVMHLRRAKSADRKGVASRGQRRRMDLPLRKNDSCAARHSEFAQ
jgi:hypothetical protein